MGESICKLISFVAHGKCFMHVCVTALPLNFNLHPPADLLAIICDNFSFQDNIDNRRAHYETTAPEIMKQVPNLDAFSCAVGTGGTLAGCSMYLKEHHPNVRVGLTDPCGAKLHRFYKNGELESQGGSITEGIGQGRITKNLEGFTPDYNFEIDDQAAMKACFEMMQSEGLALGMSSGINVAGAERLAKELGPGHTLVTILCDSASRYQGKMFNRDFLKSKGLPEPEWLSTELPADVQAALEAARVPEE